MVGDTSDYVKLVALVKKKVTSYLDRHAGANVAIESPGSSAWAVHRGGELGRRRKWH